MATKMKQVAAVLIVNGRIAAATNRVTLAHAWYSLHFTMSQETPQNASSVDGGGEAFGSPIHGFLGRPETNRQTDRRTDRHARSVAIVHSQIRLQQHWPAIYTDKARPTSSS